MNEDKKSGTIRINDGEFLRVDREISFIIYYLNLKGIKTLGCCSGHGRYKTTIIFKGEDGKIKELLSGMEIPRKKRFYVKDKKGFYYVPEVDEEKK